MFVGIVLKMRKIVAYAQDQHMMILLEIILKVTIVQIVGSILLVKNIAREFPYHAESVARLFYEFGRDPKRYKDIAEYMVDELKHYPREIADKIISAAINQFEDFPKPRDLRRFAQDYNSGNSGPDTVYPCDDCWGEGVVIVVHDDKKNII